MSKKVSLKVLEQNLSAVESCIQSIEYFSVTDEVRELRDNWDICKDTIEKFKTSLSNLLGEVER